MPEFPSSSCFWMQLLKYSRHPYPKIRLYSCRILFLLAERFDWKLDSEEGMLEFALGFLSDVDPRIRQVSLSFISRHVSALNACKYTNLIHEWMNEQDESVLIEIVRLLGKLYQMYELPSNPYTDSKRQYIFLDICTLGNHSLKLVRLEAFKILESLNNIPPSLLLQSLDKKPIQESIEYKSNPGLGVFVQGLEDEFKCVRLAALGNLRIHSNSYHEIEAMGSQCCKNNQQVEFLSDAIELIIDMLTDETRQVFIVALECLLRIGELKLLPMTLSLLEPILTLLVDTQNALIFKLLGHISISQLSLFHLLIQHLVSLVEKEKNISFDVYECVLKLGQNHSNLVIQSSELLEEIEKNFTLYSKLTFKGILYLLANLYR